MSFAAWLSDESHKKKTTKRTTRGDRKNVKILCHTVFQSFFKTSCLPDKIKMVKRKKSRLRIFCRLLYKMECINFFLIYLKIKIALNCSFTGRGKIEAGKQTFFTKGHSLFTFYRSCFLI